MQNPHKDDIISHVNQVKIGGWSGTYQVKDCFTVSKKNKSGETAEDIRIQTESARKKLTHKKK